MCAKVVYQHMALWVDMTALDVLPECEGVNEDNRRGQRVIFAVG